MSQGCAPDALLLRELQQLLVDPSVARQKPRATAGIADASKQFRVMLRREPARRPAARSAPPPLSGAPAGPPAGAAGGLILEEQPRSAVSARQMAVSKGDCGSGCEAARAAMNWPSLSRMPRSCTVAQGRSQAQSLLEMSVSSKQPIGRTSREFPLMYKQKGEATEHNQKGIGHKSHPNMHIHDKPFLPVRQAERHAQAEGNSSRLARFYWHRCVVHWLQMPIIIITQTVRKGYQ